MTGYPGRSAGVWTVMPDGFRISPVPVERRLTAGVIDSGTPAPRSPVAGYKRFGDRYWRDLWSGTDQSILGMGGPTVLGSRGSATEPVREERYPVVPLLRESVTSRRVSFAQEVAVIESTSCLFSLVGTPDSLTEPKTGDPEPLDRGLIQFIQPDYMLFPREEPKDDSDGVSTFFRLFLPRQAFIRLFDRVISRSWLAPLHFLTRLLQFPDGTPWRPRLRPRM